MLEWGSGDSSLWFRANMQKDQLLVSVENDKRYADRTGAIHIPFNSGRNATTGEEELLPGWEEYVNAPFKLANTRFDVILVDGVVRTECMLAAKKLLKTGGKQYRPVMLRV